MPGPAPASASRSSLSYNEALAAGGSAHLDDANVPAQGPRPAPSPVSLADQAAVEMDRGLRALTHAAAHPVEAAEVALEHVTAHPGHAAHLAAHKILHSAKHKLEHTSFTTGAVALKHISTGLTALMVADIAIGPNALRDHEKAEVRRSYDLATAQLASNVLPRSYLQAEVQPQASKTAVVLGGMQRTLERKLGSPEKAEVAMRQFQKDAEHAAFAGMEHAASHDLRSTAARDALLAKDAGFRDRYESDLGFRAGVDAMAWLGDNQPAEFAQRRALLAGHGARTVQGR